MSEEIARQWLAEVARTATNKEYEAHIALISKKVSLQGVPGYENIGYDAWAKQCKHEFENDALKSVRYEGLKMLVDTDRRIMFKTVEIVEGIDGSSSGQGIEVLLEKEDDGEWRLVQERVMNDDETAQAGLRQ